MALVATGGPSRVRNRRNCAQILIPHEGMGFRGGMAFLRHSLRWIRNDCLTSLLQPRILSFGLLQDGDVGVGVFPEGEEVLVGGESTDTGGIGVSVL